MLDFGGKTLLQRQLDAYKNGIKDISLVRGYKKEKINYKGIRYFENPDYLNNNILNSIFYGEDVINNNIIISYSDILFDPIVVKKEHLKPTMIFLSSLTLIGEATTLEEKITQYQRLKM